MAPDPKLGESSPSPSPAPSSSPKEGVANSPSNLPSNLPLESDRPLEQAGNSTSDGDNSKATSDRETIEESAAPGSPSPAATPVPSAESPTKLPTESPTKSPAESPAESPTKSPTESPAESRSQSEPASPLARLPKQLQQYSQDLIELGVFSLKQSGSEDKSKSSLYLLEPISRGEYARWLLAANNKIYGNRPAQQIRPAIATDKPTFQDVLATNPDFPAIQGLTDAGIIPSPLSGDSTAVSFRPDAPLTREDMLLWKVPLDTRKTLPKASIEAIRETWGFQDSAKISPKALRAVLADFQNGDFANIRRSFGYTTLFQPKKSVTRAEAAAALWYFGVLNEGLSARDALELESQQQRQ